MKILLTGSTGFIGSRLRTALLAAGHHVICAGRHAPAIVHPRCEWLRIDFSNATASAWQRHLAGVDVVVNLVGIFRERPGARFNALHIQGPRALFKGCAAAGVRRAVQLSALGADAEANTPYHLSKRTADEELLALPLQAVVVQPSLVFGAEGESSQRFLRLATLPLLPLPGGGRQCVQPVHLDDVVNGLQALVEAPDARWSGRRLAFVGPEPLSLRQYLQALRRSLGLGPALPLPLPAWLMRLAALVGDRRPGGLFDSAAWKMLQRGNCASADQLSVLLGRRPRQVERFIAPAQRETLRLRVQMGWLQPLLRGSLAAVWLITAAVSFGLYPVQASYALLAQAGVPEALRPLALYGAATLDLMLGLLTLASGSSPSGRPWRTWRPWLWPAQGLLILGYTAIISLRLPEFWLHPYGPLSKNLPMLALIALLWALEPRRAPPEES